MLQENIRQLRRKAGLSQEELAMRLNVVRQTVSKWEKGLSVPDTDMLVALSKVLETPVSVLLGETITEKQNRDVSELAEKVEAVNIILAEKKRKHRKILLAFFISLCIATVLVTVIIIKMDSPYLTWDYSDIETAIIGVSLHAFEWVFVRIAPLLFLFSVLGIVILCRKLALFSEKHKKLS